MLRVVLGLLTVPKVTSIRVRILCFTKEEDIVELVEKCTSVDTTYGVAKE